MEQKPALGKRIRELSRENLELLDENASLERQRDDLEEQIQHLKSGDVEVKKKKPVRIFGDPIVEVQW